MIVTSITPIFVLWTAIIIAKAWLFSMLLCRGFVPHFHNFFTYVTFNLGKSLALYVCANLRYSSAYFYVYWYGQLVELALIAAVMIELFGKVVAPICSDFVTKRKSLFRKLILGAVLCATLATAIPGPDATELVERIRLFDRWCTLLSAYGFGLVSVISYHWGIPWRARVFGIGVGFLFYFSVDAAIVLFTTWHGTDRSDIVIAAGMVAYFVAVLVWLRTFNADERDDAQLTIEDVRLAEAAADSAEAFLDRLETVAVGPGVNQ